jgi:hypothetical protein
VSGHGFSRAVSIQNDWALAPEIETQIGSVAMCVSQNAWGILFSGNACGAKEVIAVSCLQVQSFELESMIAA